MSKPIDWGTHNYIGISPCGCVRAVVADMPGHEKSTGESVADFIAGGMTVERVTHEQSRNRFGVRPGCDKHPKAATK